MFYSTFNTLPNDQLKEPMFFGNPVNVSRYDQQKIALFNRLTEKLHSFFWRPQEVDVTKDRNDWNKMSENEKHIFLSNLKYQILLDSMTARSVSMMFLQIVSLPELETYIETVAFSETIHSLSYTHIIRNMLPNPDEVFNDIVVNPVIIDRAKSTAKYFDDLIFYSQALNILGEGTHVIEGKKVLVTKRIAKEKLYLAMCTLNALESIQFYVSFACTFAFAERELCEGSAKIMKLIAREEHVHQMGTQSILNMWSTNRDDPEMYIISKELKEQGRQVFLDVVDQQKLWADYLFKDGSMIGLNGPIIKSYIEYISNRRMVEIDLEPAFDITSNPIPWIESWLVSDNVQVAPQESEISSYLVGQVDSAIEEKEFGDFEL